MEKIVFLFYKNISSVGGAEVLLFKHYNFLKKAGFSPKLICFKYKNTEISNVGNDDIIIASSIIGLTRLIIKFKPIYSFCHSGYIDFSIASLFSKNKFSTFIHHPTTMSFNETDKISIFFFKKYIKFARKDCMFQKIVDMKKKKNLYEMFYINLRALISQFLIRRSEKIFVLSDYAKKEKKEIFGIDSIALSGGIDKNKLITDVQPSNKILKDKYEFVTLSRLDKNKRIGVIIESLKILKDKNIDFNMNIIGIGPHEEYLKKLSESLGMTDHINFLGYLTKDKADYYLKAMDMFITIDWADYRITTFEILLYNKKLILSDETERDSWLDQSGYVKYSKPDPHSLSKRIFKHLNSSINCSNQDLENYLFNFQWDNYFQSINKHVELSI